MKFANFKEVFDYLWQDKVYYPEKRQERMAFALDYFNHPERDLPVIHLTGTNGKGSTLAYLRDLLLSQGLKVGTFTSPHIVTCTERLSLNGQNISDQAMLALFNRLALLMEELESRQLGPLVEFELYTIMMLLYFQEVQPDVCLVEVGIGGRDDATNVVDGQIAIITSIGLDHADRLGSTVESVAQIKAAIIKEGAKLVLGQVPDTTLPIISAYAQGQNASIWHWGQDFQAAQVSLLGQKGAEFTYQSRLSRQESCHIQMLGRHQVHNACLALQAFELWMKDMGQAIDWDQAKTALSRTHWLARMEKLSQDPLIYIDGAHNMHGLQALRQLIDDHFADYQIHLLYAGISTKDHHEQIPYLLTFPLASLTLTSFSHVKAMTQTDFESILQDLPAHDQASIAWQGDWIQYLKNYLTQSQSGPSRQLLLITGSLYFVSEVREYLTQEKAEY
ncbi:bifunctional folylpolyglutamate synthase/dihydrofolate synthase [Vaginisenegalia massiliensis]|uniref:bifunctional folylpolyglutamate synthase/dihydrofolate synthase n=1 Tax=Vaginisenegalia massiliensis TaxID=2058294 RepID=UPI000F5357B1|nr:folylpolyglutamate synthase/dihydrofolate synthase family protein [Vaginisenegalia massiliensis]